MNHSANDHRADGLHLDPDIRSDVSRRLLSVRGHIEGIIRMLDNESIYCIDVLKQVKAVQGALDKVGDLVFFSHLKDHVATAAERGDTDQILAELKEVLKYR